MAFVRYPIGNVFLDDSLLTKHLFWIICHYYLIPYINVIWYFLLFSEIIKRPTKGNCWPVNNFDCFPSVLWRHRVFVLNCWPVNSFDCFPRTLWRHNCKKWKRLIITIFAKSIDFFSLFDQVIKQLFHMWFGNSQTVGPRWRGKCFELLHEVEGKVFWTVARGTTVWLFTHEITVY